MQMQTQRQPAEHVAEVTHPAEAPRLNPLAPEHLATIGLAEADIERVTALAADLNVASRGDLMAFGESIGQATDTSTRAALEEATGSDMDEAGKDLARIISLARSVDVKGLSGGKIRVPFTSLKIDPAAWPWVRRFIQSKDELVSSATSVADQIDEITNRCVGRAERLAERNRNHEGRIEQLRTEIHLHALHVAAGQLRLSQIDNDIETLGDGVLTLAEANRLADLQNSRNTLDIRVGHLVALMQSSKQDLAQSRIYLATNEALIDKLVTIARITVPSWRRTFMTALNLSDQRASVELAQMVDDATNHFLRQNADATRENAVATAEANQRAVVDIETLEHVQKQLIATVGDVIKANEEGRKRRQSDIARIGAMDGQLRAALQRQGIDQEGLQ